MKPTISKPFKSNDRTFDKVYNAFDKRDYFNSQGLAKTQIGNFERALQKNDKGAQQVLDLFKGDEKKAKDYITQVVSDRNKQKAFNNYKALKSAVDSIQKGKPNVGAVDYVKRIIHNSSQKYSIALYSTLRNKKFTKWKDVHNDIDSLIGESVNEVSDSEIKKIIKKKEKGGPYTVVVQKGNMSKHISHAKDVGDSVDKAIKVYHQFKKKHRNGVQIIDGYGRTVFFESVNEAKKTDQWTLDVIDHLEYLKYPKKDIDYIMDFEKKKIKGWKRKKLHPTTVGQQLNIILKKLRRNEAIESKSDCGCGCKGTTPGGCNESLNEEPVAVSMRNDDGSITTTIKEVKDLNEQETALYEFGQKVETLMEKNCPTNPGKWSSYKSQAKQKFDVYPSAYANGWAAKKYKAAGGGWKKC